jgi:hypothetical protein
MDRQQLKLCVPTCPLGIYWDECLMRTCSLCRLVEGSGDGDPDFSSDNGDSSEADQGRLSTSKQSRWSDLDEQRLLAYKKTGSGSLASSPAGLGPQYVRGKNMVQPRTTASSPTLLRAEKLTKRLQLVMRRTKAVNIRWENGAGEEIGGREEGKKEKWRFLIYLLRLVTSWIKQRRG